MGNVADALHEISRIIEFRMNQLIGVAEQFFISVSTAFFGKLVGIRHGSEASYQQ